MQIAFSAENPRKTIFRKSVREKLSFRRWSVAQGCPDCGRARLSRFPLLLSGRMLQEWIEHSRPKILDFFLAKSHYRVLMQIHYANCVFAGKSAKSAFPEKCVRKVEFSVAERSPVLSGLRSGATFKVLMAPRLSSWSAP